MDQNHPKEMLVSYKECMKNHAASMGGHAVDGCCEYMPMPISADPVSLKCAACGCHRNFHRRDPYDYYTASPSPEQSRSAPVSPPLPSPVPHRSYYSSAPHMLLALSTAQSRPSAFHPMDGTKRENTPSPRKRSRTKFSREQKQRMLCFAEKSGWRIPRNGDSSVNDLCREIGVERGVFKVWMHNHKNNLGKTSSSEMAIGGLNINKDDNFDLESGKKDKV